LSQSSNGNEVVNLVRYPIADLESVAGSACASDYRQQFLESGLCVLPDFILPAALQQLADEGNEVVDRAYFCESTHNAYLTDVDPGLPADDVARRQEHTYVGSVAYDHIGDNSLLRQLYHWEPLRHFIASILDKARLHRLADPLGACSINVFVDGGKHGWHFDESEFSVTMMMQQPENGGAFEYVTGVRGARDEKKQIAEILDGHHNRVVQLPFTPGTLFIFGGYQTIHRVTEVRGPVPRMVPVLCFSDRPNQSNSEKVRKMFWGRTGAESVV